jgi:hypothetical protein
MANQQEGLPDLSDQENDQDVGDDEDDTFGDSDCGWPDRETVKVIELFRDKPQLYDVQHRWYAHREKKSAVLSAMASELGIGGKLMK